VIDFDKLYQRIGEFVVSFQWLENRLREIGWLILDPHRKEWPPRSLRRDRNEELINRVQALYVGLLDRLDIDEALRQARKEEFIFLCGSCHEMRRFRNTLLHSAYIELKAGGDAVAIMRSDPKLRVDPDSGEVLYDQEILSEETIGVAMQKLAETAFSINTHYAQLLHWAPFEG
jgi:hypothetical protein